MKIVIILSLLFMSCSRLNAVNDPLPTIYEQPDIMFQGETYEAKSLDNIYRPELR